ncbi:hypothetical protein D3C80_2158900 [compost metagenome]
MNVIAFVAVQSYLTILERDPVATILAGHHYGVLAVATHRYSDVFGTGQRR